MNGELVRLSLLSHGVVMVLAHMKQVDKHKSEEHFSLRAFTNKGRIESDTDQYRASVTYAQHVIGWALKRYNNVVAVHIYLEQGKAKVDHGPDGSSTTHLVDIES